MNHVDLFSGIGGFALAAHWAGFTTVAFVEIEPYAQEIIKERFGAVADAEGIGRQQAANGCESGQSFAELGSPRIYGDIRAFDGTRYRGATLVTGGFPCQPFSQAGKRRGAADDRALWPEMFRVIQQINAYSIKFNIWVSRNHRMNDRQRRFRTAIVDAYNLDALGISIPLFNLALEHFHVAIVGHNQSKFIQHIRPAWVLGENVAGFVTMELDNCISDLEREGYAVQPLIIPACAVDARHRRDRVWIVADASRDEQGRQEQRAERQRVGLCSESVDVSDADQARRHGRAGNERQGRGREPSDCCEWLPEPDVGRVAHGVSSRVDRLKGLGNAIVPQVAYEIMKEIAMNESGAGQKFKTFSP